MTRSGGGGGRRAATRAARPRGRWVRGLFLGKPMVRLWVVLALNLPRQPHGFKVVQYQFRGGEEDGILGSFSER